MQKFKGVIKFISTLEDSAIIEQYAISAPKLATGIVIGHTTSAGDVNVEGDLIVNNAASSKEDVSLGTLIKESSVEITFGASPTVEGEDLSLATSSGQVAILASSTGAVIVDNTLEVAGETYDIGQGEFGVIVGANISPTAPSLVDYNSGEITVEAAAPIGPEGTVVRAAFLQSKVDDYPEKTVKLNGNFTGRNIGDIIYYIYVSGEEDTISIVPMS